MRLLVTNNRLAQTCATLCALCPHAEQWQTHFRIIAYVSRRGAALKTRASYVVEAGRPSLQRA